MLARIDGFSSLVRDESQGVNIRYQREKTVLGRFYTKLDADLDCNDGFIDLYDFALLANDWQKFLP